MPFPLMNFNPQGMIGAGMPYGAQQQLAQQGGLDALTGGGPRRKTAVQGLNMPLVPQTGSPIPSPPPSPVDMSDSPQVALPTPNDNGMARMPNQTPATIPASDVDLSGNSLRQFATPPFVAPNAPDPKFGNMGAPPQQTNTLDPKFGDPGGSRSPAQKELPPMPDLTENPHLAALRAQEAELAKDPDGRLRAQADVNKYGTGHKILNGIMGLFSGLSGNSPLGGSGILGGITNAVQGYRGNIDRAGLASRYAQQNVAKRQNITDQMNLEKEISGEMDKQQGRNIAQRTSDISALAHQETGRHNVADEQIRAKQNAALDNIKQQMVDAKNRGDDLRLKGLEDKYNTMLQVMAGNNNTKAAIAGAKQPIIIQMPNGSYGMNPDASVPLGQNKYPPKTGGTGRGGKQAKADDLGNPEATRTATGQIDKQIADEAQKTVNQRQAERVAADNIAKTRDSASFVPTAKTPGALQKEVADEIAAAKKSPGYKTRVNDAADDLAIKFNPTGPRAKHIQNKRSVLQQSASDLGGGERVTDNRLH